jgi:hypothetical protein
MNDSMTDAITQFMADPDRRQRLLKASEDAIESKITEQFKWSLPDAVSTVCADFIKEEIAPAVQAHLLANRGVILKAALDAADEIGVKLTEKLAETAVKNMANSWNVTKIVEGLFK